MQYHGEYKTPGGKLTVCDFSVEGGKIGNFQLSGDFFLEPDETLDLINKAVNGLSKNSSITDITDAVTSQLPVDSHLIGTSPAAIGTVIRRALTSAVSWRDYEWDIIHGEPVHPLVNAALDEVLTNAVAAGERNPTLRIWESSSPAVFIGSFQSVKNEIDIEGAKELGATVIRRISGGGAMYMVPENCITYALHVPESLVRGQSFEESYAFLDEWVIEAFQQMGFDARYVPLNDITGPQGKIGGAAQKRLGNGGVLHHVTIAYDMDAKAMMKVLRIGREKLSDKGIKSAQKRVDPLRTQTGMAREDIIAKMVAVFKQRHGGTDSELTETELQRANELVKNKFDNDEWRYRVA
ncbi:lipoate--protein ligase family protein [Canibacter sp. lx-72]|uniref:lipoate--protein ligase family protein n=1 Tax=Canibacter zhuwentaonis TaxID=2837491 RepID=UPI001BDBDB17|nr:biotin/lipoate A/B protein ligase family protein [Canibacter zhuwentaonis]MBT1018692.1 lipoate--protein ligase family protein [Canibacter zhuwentaonis]